MKLNLFRCFGVLALLMLSVGTAAADEIARVSHPSAVEGRSQYRGNRAPLAPSPFIKLPVGAVQADGWLGRCLELQRDGLTGRLGTISKWLEKKNNAWLHQGGDHGWEEVPYWLRGYGDLAYLLRDETMIAETKVWLDAIFSGQREDGYFGPANPDTEKGCDLWPNMLVLFAMQSYFEYSGDERVIAFMTKYFEWALSYPEEKFLKTYWENSRAGDMLLSCFWLYNITGNEKLLALAEKIKRNAADWGQESTLPNWHNVNIAQCFRLPAEWWMYSHDEKDKRATYNDFWLIRAVCGQVPGGMFGADENVRLGYIDPRQGVETCGIFEQMTSDMILVRVTGDPAWADNAEDVALNTAPAALMPDFKALRYIICPNQPISDHQNHHPGIGNAGPFMMMNPFSSRCCQHNHSHGWPYYVENLWLATPDGGLAAALYGAARVTAKVGTGETVTVAEETDYPFEETVRFTVQTGGKPVAFPIYFRVPRWIGSMTAALNGTPLDFSEENAPKPGTWLKIDRTWNDGDRIAVFMPMKFSVRTWQQNKNCVSVDYGPLTFSLKIKERYDKIDGKSSSMGDSGWQESADEKDWPSFNIFPDSAWNYGLIDPASVDWASMKPTRKEWPSDQFPWTADAVPLSIRLKGKKVPAWQIDSFGLAAPVPPSPAASDQPSEEIELIPMGAARLRISAFPTVAP